MRSAASVTPAVMSLNVGSLHADIQPWFGGRLLALYDQLQDRRIDWIEPATPASEQAPGHVKAGHWLGWDRIGGLDTLDTCHDTSVRILRAGESLTGSMTLRCGKGICKTMAPSSGSFSTPPTNS